MISGDRSLPQGKKSAFYYTLEEMSKHWDRIDVICPRPGPNPLPETEGMCFFHNVYFHPSLQKLSFQQKWILKKGKELINQYRHNVMTVHEYPPFYNGKGALRLHKVTKIPYMTEIHHIVGYPRAASLQEWIGYYMSRKWLPGDGTNYASIVRVVDPETYSLLHNWGVNPKKIRMIPSLYLDFNELNPDPSIEKKYDIAFAARLVENKGLLEVLQAMAKMKNVSLLVIGDGPKRKEMEELSHELGIDNRVTFVGWLPTNVDVYRAIQSAKIFVMNSKSEGGPRVLFEAMALKIPAIITKVGLAPHFLENGKNYIYTNGTPRDLKGKIESLLSNDDLRLNLAEKTRERLLSFERSKRIKIYADTLKDIARA